MSDQLVAVCTPELYQRYGAVNQPADILTYPLLHHVSFHSSTQLWLREAGLDLKAIDALPGQRLEHFSLMVQVAQQGLGIAVVPKYFVESELVQGELLEASSQPLECSDCYYVVTPISRRLDPQVQAFSQWLLSWAQK